MMKKLIAFLLVFTLIIPAGSATAFAGGDEANYLDSPVQADTNITQAPIEIDNPFQDVPYDSLYKWAVLWARAAGVTDGISRTKFGPGNTCTRGQVVTFLWRAAGCPEPETLDCQFTDVVDTDYYYKAVLWAVEMGITDGINKAKTLFGPERTCTEAQILTFIWRYRGKPEAHKAGSPFEFFSTELYYKPALEWGWYMGLVDESLLVESPCPRSHVVQYLYGMEGWPLVHELRPEDGIKCVVVNTIDDLLKNAGDNTIIYLAPGDYDLGRWADAKADYMWQQQEKYPKVTLEDTGDKFYEVQIRGCKGLTLRHVGHANIDITMNRSQSHVLLFADCQDLTLNNFSVTSRAQTPSNGAVLRFEECKNIWMDYMTLSGKLLFGITAELCQTLHMDRSVIGGCDLGILGFVNCKDFNFDQLNANGNQGYCLITSIASDIRFEDSYFMGNQWYTEDDNYIMLQDMLAESSFLDCCFDQDALDSLEAYSKTNRKISLSNCQAVYMGL